MTCGTLQGLCIVARTGTLDLFTCRFYNKVFLMLNVMESTMYSRFRVSYPVCANQG